MRTLDEILDEYLRVLEQHGSLTPKTIATLDPSTDWGQVNFPAEVTPFDDLKTYFTRINGCDWNSESELDLFEPVLAWDMHPLSLEESLDRHQMAGENPDYWPRGFLPILENCSGSFVVVNCLADSPRYGAVYDMGDCVGCNRISDSLREFFEASTQEVLLGLRKYSRDQSSTPSRDYLEEAAPLFGNTPFFTLERGGEQVVDWRKDSPPPPVRAPRKRPPEVPPNPGAVRWAEVAGVAPPTEMNGYNIRLSTAPVEHWFFQQSKLKPDTVDLSAGIGSQGWVVKLTRRDNLFLVRWQDGQPCSVSSEQMKYNRLLRWPALEKIEDFPLLPKKLEGLLGIKFVSYADVTQGSGDTRDFLSNPRFLAWLAPCASRVDGYIGAETAGNSPRK